MKTLLLSLFVYVFSIYVVGQTQLPILEEFDNFDGPGEWISPGGNTGSDVVELCYNISGSYLGNVWYVFESPVYDFSSYASIELFWYQDINLRTGDEFRLYYFDLSDSLWYYFSLEGLGSGFQGATIPPTANQITFDLLTIGSGNRSGKYAHVGFLEISTPTVLPVELLYFEGGLSEEGVNLRWATASENNSSHFLIHRSINADSWDEIAYIPAAGYSTQELIYSYHDPESINGTVYYKLEQVDYDGASETFKPISVYREGSPHNPSTKLYDLLGREIVEPKGIYIQINTEGSRTFYKGN